jgi:hypothetical protein
VDAETDSLDLSSVSLISANIKITMRAAFLLLLACLSFSNSQQIFNNPCRERPVLQNFDVQKVNKIFDYDYATNYLVVALSIDLYNRWRVALSQNIIELKTFKKG